MISKTMQPVGFISAMTEDWEDEEADGSLLFTISDYVKTPMGLFFWVVVAAVAAYFFLAVYSAFFDKSRLNSKYKKEVHDEPFRKYNVDEDQGEEGGGGGTLSSLGSSVTSRLGFEAPPPPPPEIEYTATVSCIPFGCPPERIAGAFAIDQQSGVGFMFGGLDEKGFRSDGWLFDTGDLEWRDMGLPEHPTDEEREYTPGKRVHVRMAVANGYVVMFGGSVPRKDCTADLYERARASANRVLLLLRVVAGHFSQLTPLFCARFARAGTCSTPRSSRGPGPTSLRGGRRTPTHPPRPRPGSDTPCARTETTPSCSGAWGKVMCT
jgi:hypothetical protein